MAKTEISITRALKELKLLDQRIRNALTNPFIAVQKGTGSSAEVVGTSGVKPEEYAKALKANIDKVRGMITYRAELKAKVVQSNAVTQVTIGTEIMTVAVAIEQKEFVSTRQSFVETLINQAQTAQRTIETGNNALEVAIETQLITMLGKEKGKVPTEEERKAVVNPMEATRKLSLIDPNKVAELAQVEMEKLNTFINEVDFVLSESNSLTKITVDDGKPSTPTTA